jgi:hypothetical protein
LALAICGDAGEAQKLTAEISKLSPNDTLWNNVQLPEIHAAIALERNQPAESVDLLASASPYEGAFLEAAYLRGLAYLRLNKGSEAVAEFQKIVDHQGAGWASRWQHPYWAQVWSLSYLGLARGYVLAQDEATSVIFGMPAEAIRTGAVDQVVGIDDMYAAIEKYIEPLCRQTQPIGSR